MALQQRASVKGVTLNQTTTVTAPCGTVVSRGDVVAIAGVPGKFRFMNGRCDGTEATVYGPVMVDMDKAYAGVRTFRTDAIRQVNAVAVAMTKAVEKATVNGEGDYASMSPGQKAAWTKRMRAQAAAQVAA